MLHPNPDSSEPRIQAGLGLRRALLKPLLAAPAGDFDFLELAPENWLSVGGAHGKALRQLAERHPVYCHGLSLSLGGIAPPDETLLRDIRVFLDDYRVPLYSEHLSYCTHTAHQYALPPLPFTHTEARSD